MYKLTGKETISVSNEMPSPGTAGEQVYISNSKHGVLGYQIALSEQGWQPSNAQLDLGGAGDAFAIVAVNNPTFDIWTPYCQEGLGEHPLSSHGLGLFDVFEVKNSIFCEEHVWFPRNHFVFQFEDSTLDVICSSLVAYLFKGDVVKMEQKVFELYQTNA